MTDNPFPENGPQADNEPLVVTDTTLGEGREPVPDELLERAVKLVQGVVKGNGMRGLQVALADFEGEILKFETYELFRMDPQISEKRVSGKQNGEVAGSVTDMRAKMQGVLSKVTENPEVKKYVIELMRKRLDLGFALENQTVALEAYNKRYVVHDLCSSCGGKKSLACGVCHGDGRATCYRCKGAMTVDCPMCGGHGTIAAGGARKTCTKCNGKRRSACPLCRGRGFTSCKNCKGDGRLNCQQCNTTGWHSTIGALIVKTKCSFWYDKEALIEGDQAPEVPPIIDDFGPRMVLEKHADITFIEDVERLKQLDLEVKKDEFKIPYKVRLPFGSISFRLKDKIVNGKLFGLHPLLVHMDPFLEEPLLPGITLLEEAAREPGNAIIKIKESSRYRAIGEALVLASRMGIGRAVESYEKRYPFGLKKETLRKILVDADLALKNVTRGPRRVGVAIGGFLTGVILAGFYLSPLRSYIYPSLTIDAVRIMLDVFLLLAAMGIMWLTIQSAATRALQEAMAHLLPPDKRKKLTPKPGAAGIVGIVLVAVLWLAMVPLTQIIGGVAPFWFQKIMLLL